jgi:hypothetical protein
MVDGVAGAAQQRGDAPRQRGIVLHDQDTHRPSVS